MKYDKIITAMESVEREITKTADKVSAKDKKFLAKVMEMVLNLKTDVQWENSTTKEEIEEGGAI